MTSLLFAEIRFMFCLKMIFVSVQPSLPFRYRYYRMYIKVVLLNASSRYINVAGPSSIQNSNQRVFNEMLVVPCVTSHAFCTYITWCLPWKTVMFLFDISLRMIQDIDLRCFVYDGYGKSFVKKQKMSPDAWIQMAFQLTFYRYCVCK